MSEGTETPFTPVAGNRMYQPYGTAKQFLYCKDSEVLYAGPAGTGKSICCLNRLYLICEKYPGARCLMVRKTRESLSESALVTWEQEVVPEGHPMLNGPQRRMRQSYQFGNGSEIILGGLDKAQKVMSTQYDIIYVMEAIEVTQEDWESLVSRKGRRTAVPYQQIIADTNPSYPNHWLKKRCDAGVTTLIQSRHQDNPLFFNQRTGEITPMGAKYLAQFQTMDPLRRKRLGEGLWVQAEGAVFEMWDEQIHVVDDFPIPPEWPRYWSMDFGFRNPCVLQMWAEDPDGNIYLFREFYKTNTLIEDVAAYAKRMMDEDLEQCRKQIFDALPRGEIDADSARRLDALHEMLKPKAVIADHDAEDRATFERHTGLLTRPGNKAVLAGIQTMSEWLRVGVNGKPRIRILRSALFNERDPVLKQAQKPQCTREEMEGYVWEDGKVKESPVKLNDHGCFVAGTLITTARGLVPIEQVDTTDEVLTRDGFRPVVAAGMTDPSASVLTVIFSNGEQLTGTGNHPIWVEGRGYVPLDSMCYGDLVLSHNEVHQWKSFSSTSPKTWSGSGSWEPSTDGIQRLSRVLTGTTSALAKATSSTGSRISTETCGLPTRDQSPMVTRLTTAMGTRSTTTWGTFNFSARRNTLPSISQRWLSGASESSPTWTPMFAPTCSARPQSGTPAKRDSRGILNTRDVYSTTCQKLHSSASSAERITPSSSTKRTRLGSALTTASQRTVETPESMTLTANASDVGLCSASTGMQRRNAVPLCVLSVSAEPVKRPVYNLTVNGPHEYFANGVLVHNCDATRYVCMYLNKRVSLHGGVVTY